MEDGSGLRELVDHALHAGSGEDALRAVAALRSAIDGLERAQARRALAEGSSFGAVARALGITRQSAHRRYRDLLAEPSPALARVVVTPEAQQAMECASEEARGLGMASVGSEHLLLGIVRCADGPTAAVLRGLGVTLDAARACALPTETGEPPATRKGISDYARTVLEAALHDAVDRGDGCIGTGDLLVAALGDPHGGAARTLEALGVPPEAVRAHLDSAGTT